MARKPKTNCIKNGVPYFRIRREVGKNSAGDKKYKDFYGGSETDANGKYLDYLAAEKEEKSDEDAKDRILKDEIETWLWETYYRSFEKDATFSRYEGVYQKYIVPAPFMTMNLKDVRAKHIQEHFNNLQDEGEASDSTIKFMHIILKAFFNYAVLQQYAEFNIMLSVIRPKKKLSETFDVDEEDLEVDYFTSEELKILISGSADHALHHFIKIKVSMGLRRGEMLGSRWKYHNWENKTQYINSSLSRSYVYDKDHKKSMQYVMSTPKNAESRRYAPYQASIATDFKAIKRKQALDKLKAGPAYEDNDLIFCTSLGTPINPSNLEKSWRNLLKKLGLRHRKIHALRHTFATQLFAKGVQIEIVSKLLGHKSIETTRQIYVHILKSTKTYTVDMLQDIL